MSYTVVTATEQVYNKELDMSYIAKIESRVAGIPCIIGVTHFESVKGSFDYHADSDWDYHGYTECEFEMLDRKGYKAKWLESKITQDDESEIESIIIKHFEKEAEYEY